MIEFYHMVAPRAIPLGELGLDEVGNISAICMADILNKNDGLRNMACDFHPEAVEKIAVLYTHMQLEFIITETCCPPAKEALEKMTVQLKKALEPFWQED